MKRNNSSEAEEACWLGKNKRVELNIIRTEVGGLGSIRTSSHKQREDKRRLFGMKKMKNIRMRLLCQALEGGKREI